jgi:hypothetical protein
LRTYAEFSKSVAEVEVNAMKEGKSVMPNMGLSTSARSIVDKSDLQNSKKIQAASQAAVSTPLWSLAATAGEVTKHAKGILQQQHLLATTKGGFYGYSCVPTNKHMWLVRGDAPSHVTLKKEEDKWYFHSPLP